MSRFKVYIIGVAVFFLMIMIPITVMGAIAESPIEFIGEIIFSEGDTSKVSDEVKEMYNQFMQSKIGKQTLDYISEKNSEKDKIYHSAYYTIPLLLTIEEASGDADFNTLGWKGKIDTLFALRYQSESDTRYLKGIKQNGAFNRVKNLSDTTLMVYINYFTGTANGNYSVIGESETGNAIALKALSKIGCPYWWGAPGGGFGDGQGLDNPNANYFDCSGLVAWAHRQSGVKIGRMTADDYSNSGKRITRNDLQAGDVITFDYDEDGIADHIGIYIGDGRMVHASGEGETCLGNHSAQKHVVKVADVLNSAYWMNNVKNYRRLY